MRVNRGLLGWGVFFIVLGAVPIAVRSGAIPAELVRRAWDLWPLVLIGIGLGLVLERTRLAIVGGLVVALTFGLMGGALIATGTGWANGGAITTCGIGGGADSGQPFETRSGTFDGSARVTLSMNCGDARVSAADGPGWSVAGSSDKGRSPNVTASGSQLTVRTPEGGVTPFVDAAWRWDVVLPRAGETDLDLSLNAGSARADLAGMTLGSVSADVNAGDAKVNLGSALRVAHIQASVNAGSLSITLPSPATNLTGDVSVNVGSIEVCVAPGTPLRIRMGDDPLAGNNFDRRGLVRDGNTWTSTTWSGSASGSVELNVDANLGSITLDPENGCD
jgi:hypothetical protein